MLVSFLYIFNKCLVKQYKIFFPYQDSIIVQKSGRSLGFKPNQTLSRFFVIFTLSAIACVLVFMVMFKLFHELPVISMIYIKFSAIKFNM